MEFIADPGFVDVVCLLKLVDNALTDIAKGSDIIGENLYLYWHRSSSLSPNKWTPLYLPFLSKSYATVAVPAISQA